MRFRKPHSIRAKGRPNRRKLPGQMNGLERAFYENMQTWSGIVAIDYERFTFKLADDTRYTPDFYALRESGQVQFYECKGFEFQHSMVKAKVAAGMWPEFEFFMVKRIPKKDGGGWDIKLVGNKETEASNEKVS